MTYSKLKFTVDGGVGVITMADPATMNAASVEMARELIDVFSEIAQGESAVRAVVLTGEGRGFCSGANLNNRLGEEANSGDGKPDAGDALGHTYNPLVTLMRDLPVPIVTAVNGAAAGIGCSFALLGDIIVGAESAYFLQAFRRIGLIPDGGSTYLLPRMIGKARAMEMMLLGERICSAKALEWGLINRCVPDADLMPTAMALASELAKGPLSLGLIRKAVWASLDTAWSEQLHHERITQAVASGSQDFIEGVSAFLAKRPASFNGR